MAGQPPPVQPPTMDYGQTRPSSGLAIASMVLGIVGLALFCLWYVSIPCSVLAVILGTVARRNAAAGTAGGKSMATAGLICGLISIGLVILFLVGCLAILGLGAGAAGGIGEFQKQMEREMERMKNKAPVSPGAMLQPLVSYARAWLA